MPSAPRFPAAVAIRCAAALALATYVVGCGASGSSPVETVQGYLSALAEGNYAGACAMLDSTARASLFRVIGQHASCSAVFKRCLPYVATTPQKDQSQLFYSTVDVSLDSRGAEAAVSGTPVADAVREVRLAEHRGVWILTSYGQGLKGCPGRADPPRGAGRRSAKSGR